MKSFIELDGQGIFIKPESIVSIEPMEGSKYEKIGVTTQSYVNTTPPRLLIRTHGREEHPYAFHCASFESAKEQARLLAEKVEALLNPQDPLQTPSSEAPLAQPSKS